MSIDFDEHSRANLQQLHPLLQKLFIAARKEYNFIVTDSRRNKAGQMLALKDGFSTVAFGDSPHNYSPALAGDIAPAPYALYRNNIPRYIEMQMKIIKPMAMRLSIPIRQGLDWNRNGILTDENFHDYPHVELYPWRKYIHETSLFI